MTILTRRRRLSDNSWSGLAAQGKAKPVNPAALSGWLRYGAGRQLEPASDNLIKNPRLVDANADTTPDLWAKASTVTGTPVYSVIDRGSHYAYRVQYTGVAGDSAGNLALYAYFSTDSGDIAPGDALTFQAKISGVSTGCYPRLAMITRQAGGTVVDNVAGADLTITAVPTPYSTSIASAGALSAKADVRLYIASIGPDDVVDITWEQPKLSKLAAVDAYHDGTYPDCAWTGTADASESTRTASVLSYAAGLAGTEGGIAFRITPEWASNDSVAHPILTIRNTADDADAVTITKDAANKWSLKLNDGTNTPEILSAAQTTAANLPVYVFARWSATKLDLRVGTTDSAQVDNTATLTVGKLVFAASKSFIGPVVVCKTRPTDGMVAAVNTAGAYAAPQTLFGSVTSGDSVLPLGGNSVAYTKVSGACPFESVGRIVFDGDSLSTEWIGVKWANQFRTLYGNRWDWRNVAVAGQGTAAMVDDAVAQVDPLYDATAPVNIVTCWCGTNDVDWDVSYTNIAAYAAARRAAGFKVVAFTILPRADDTEPLYEAARLQFNVDMRAGWATFADALADVCADSRIGDPGDELDETYYDSGHVHMTAAGYAVVAGIVKTAIEGML